MPMTPMPGGASAPAQAAPMDMSGLMGPQDPGSMPGGVPAPSPSPEDQSKALMDQFRTLTVQLQAIARQYPAAAQDLQAASDALVSAMTKVLISQSSTESQSAPVGLA